MITKYIRELLLFARRIDVRLTIRSKIISLIGLVIFVILGLVVDKFLPFNIIANTLRAGIACVIGLYLFIAFYLVSRHIVRHDSDGNVIERENFRLKFSYSQRVNISIVLFGVIALFALVGSKPSQVFTLFSSFLVLSILWVLAFVRSTREENEIAKTGFDDPRDVKFRRAKEDELKRRESKRKEKLKEKSKNEVD